MCNIIRLDSIVICQHMYNITFDDVTNVLETIDRSRVLQ